LNELNEMRKLNHALSKELEKLRISAKFVIPDLAPLESKYSIRFKTVSLGYSRTKSIELDWQRIFSLVGPSINIRKDSDVIGGALISALELERVLDPDINNYIVKEDEETIKFQLAAYGFVEISNENGRLSLTELGTRTLLNLKAVRKADAVHKIA
jgi:hypothetical protein